MSSPPSPAAGRTRIPADVDRPDRILAGLTARQLALLIPPLLLAVAVYWTARPYLPLPVIAVLCLPLVAGGVILTLGQRAGLPLDRYAAAALAHRRTPRVQVPAPDGLPAIPGWVPDIAAARRDQPAPARPLAAGADPAGVLDLHGGVAVVAEVNATNVHLATEQERAVKVAAFARMLNAVSGPVQITVRGVPVDLDGHIDRLHAYAGRLHPVLADAAVDHADFLAAMARGRALRERQILFTAYQPLAAGRPGRVGRDSAAGRALRQIEEAAGLLATAGLHVRPLDGAGLTQLLAAAAHPDLPPPPAQATAHGTVHAGGESR